MRDIAAQLDIKAASLYNHITSKDDIITDISMEMVQGLCRELEYMRIERGDFHTKFTKLIDLVYNFIWKNKDAYLVYIQNWQVVKDKVPEVQTFRNNYEYVVTSLLKEQYGMASLVTIYLYKDLIMEKIPAGFLMQKNASLDDMKDISQKVIKAWA